MWQIIERMCYEEINRGVLQGLLPPISRLGSTDGARVAELSKAIFLRIEDGDGSEKVREMCTSIFTGLFLWQDNPTAEEILSLIGQQLNSFHREARRIIIDLREYFTIGSIPVADPLEEQVRQRAFFLVKKILQSVLDSLQTLEVEHEQKPYTNWSEHEQQTVKAKSCRITLENRDRCGSRSSGEQGAFCEIWRFEQHLCCRTCAFEDVCTKAEVFQGLPCKDGSTSV